MRREGKTALKSVETGACDSPKDGDCWAFSWPHADGTKIIIAGPGDSLTSGHLALMSDLSVLSAPAFVTSKTVSPDAKNRPVDWDSLHIFMDDHVRAGGNVQEAAR